jgi:ABC-type Zn2+ transport system substrate-binding protein/surface adhesin
LKSKIARVTAGEQDREERHDGQDDERDPVEHEHDDVRDHQDPLDQPHPAAEVAIKLPFDPQRIHGWCGVLVHGTHSSRTSM